MFSFSPYLLSMVCRVVFRSWCAWWREFLVSWLICWRSWEEACFERRRRYRRFDVGCVGWLVFVGGGCLVWLFGGMGSEGVDGCICWREWGELEWVVCEWVGDFFDWRQWNWPRCLLGDLVHSHVCWG